MQRFKWLIGIVVLIGILGWRTDYFEIGVPIDNLNGVVVYYNGKKFSNVSGRHFAKDGYNLGLKYQCVEFVKRYYYEYFNHKMPDVYGHAKDYFDNRIEEEGWNAKRGLMQYSNAGTKPPQANDIIVFGASPGNQFGHVAIIAAVENDHIEVIQQNIGIRSRAIYPLVQYLDYWTVADEYVLGWLRLGDD